MCGLQARASKAPTTVGNDEMVAQAHSVCMWPTTRPSGSAAALSPCCEAPGSCTVAQADCYDCCSRFTGKAIQASNRQEVCMPMHCSVLHTHLDSILWLHRECILVRSDEQDFRQVTVQLGQVTHMAPSVPLRAVPVQPACPVSSFKGLKAAKCRGHQQPVASALLYPA